VAAPLAVAEQLPQRKRGETGSQDLLTTDVGLRQLLEKGPTVIRSKYLVLAAIAVVLCVGASSATAQPIDRGPIVKYGASPALRLPPPDNAPAPGMPQWPANPQPLPPPSSARADDGVSPWVVGGLAAGGVLLLAGGIAGIRRSRRARRPVV
jgi:hypothetical protein